jgi:hypothetical protein
MVTCFWMPSEMSTWVRMQLTHMLVGLGEMLVPHRQHSLQQGWHQPGGAGSRAGVSQWRRLAAVAACLPPLPGAGAAGHACGRRMAGDREHPVPLRLPCQSVPYAGRQEPPAHTWPCVWCGMKVSWPVGVAKMAWSILKSMVLLCWQRHRGER